MGRNKNNTGPTSIWADKQTRDALKDMADKMGVPQGKCIDLLIKEKIHRDKIYNKRKRKELMNKLPVPVHAETFQRNGYKTVVFVLDEEK